MTAPEGSAPEGSGQEGPGEPPQPVRVVPERCPQKLPAGAGLRLPALPGSGCAGTGGADARDCLVPSKRYGSTRREENSAASCV